MVLLVSSTCCLVLEVVGKDMVNLRDKLADVIIGCFFAFTIFSMLFLLIQVVEVMVAMTK